MKNKNEPDDDNIKTKQLSARMDFLSEIISFDKETGIIELILKPDPQRYEWIELKGKRCLYDKFDKICYPKEVLFKMAEQVSGKPGYFQPPLIDNADSYIKSRESVIEKMLDSSVSTTTFEDKSEEFLQSLSKDMLGFVILSLDIVESTKLAASLAPEIYKTVISTTLYELSEIVPKFHGHVLKYTGDGLIAYFPEPSFILKNDLAIVCALTLRILVYEALNPILIKRGFPSIGIRIGLDAGEAYVVTIGSPETKQHKDIIGVVVNLASKIQSKASPGEIYLGDTVLRHLHTMWRQICEPVDLDKKWEYRDLRGVIYKIHKISFGIQ